MAPKGIRLANGYGQLKGKTFRIAHMGEIQLADLEADEVSAFLVIAAKLLQIKSEALLPRPPQRELGEEDPGEALARQLVIYKRYREIAMILGEREAQGLRTYLRVAPPVKIEGSYDLTGISIEDIATAAQEIFFNLSYTDALYSVVPPARVTIREKIFAEQMARFA